MSYKAPPYATLALPPLSCIAFIPSSTIDSFTSIPPNPPEKSPKATKEEKQFKNFSSNLLSNMINEAYHESFLPILT